MLNKGFIVALPEPVSNSNVPVGNPLSDTKGTLCDVPVNVLDCALGLAFPDMSNSEGQKTKMGKGPDNEVARANKEAENVEMVNLEEERTVPELGVLDQGGVN